MKKIVLTLLLFLTACATTTISSTPVVVKIYITPAAQPWQAKLFDCAAKQSLVPMVSDPQSADILLRLGEPAELATPAFQIDTDEVLVIVNKEVPFNQLTREQVIGLFSGQIEDWAQIDPSKTGAVQAWVFAEDEDVQTAFASTLAGSQIVSTARLAASPDEMSQAIASDPNAIGILSRRWKTGNVSEVYTAATIPVLAITPAEPQNEIKTLLACMQTKP